MSKSHYQDPEKRVHEFLFMFGLIVEGFAIFYAFYSLQINGASFYRSFSLAVHCSLLLALFALLIHQFYIRNSILDVNHYVSNPTSNKPDWIPASLKSFRTEFYIRYLLFILLAAISGEIPYLAMVISEKIHYEEFKKYSSFIFIVCCFFLSATVFVWDFCLIFSDVIEKLKSDTSNVKKRDLIINTIFNFSSDDSVKVFLKKSVIFVFLISDFLSSILWLIIIVFIKTRDPNLVTYISAIAIIYWLMIVVVRRIFLGSDPVKAEY